MADLYFEALDKPSKTGTSKKIWYVEVFGDSNRCLTTDCYISAARGCTGPLYYVNEADAYECMERYYLKYNATFPYHNEMLLAQIRAGYTTTVSSTVVGESRVMEFI